MMVLKAFNQMTPFKSGAKYDVERLIFFLVDDEKEGHVIDYSESCGKFLQKYGIKSKVLTNGIVLRISDLLVDLNYNQFLANRQARQKSGEVYESNHRLDISQFSERSAL